MLKSQCYSFSSSSQNGAFNKNKDNNQFSENFTPSPLQLPENAENCKIEIIRCQLWNNSPNVITGKNDVFSIQDPSGIHSINLEQGQYDVDSLYQQIALQFNNKPAGQAIYFSSIESVFNVVL
jgi:hypothetical protein